MTDNTPEPIGVAGELRELAAAIEQLTRSSPCCSVAWEPVIMLVEHLIGRDMRPVHTHTSAASSAARNCLW